jgi:hypothetical protein
MKKISGHSRHVVRLCSICDFGEVILTKFYFNRGFFNKPPFGCRGGRVDADLIQRAVAAPIFQNSVKPAPKSK